MNTVIVVIVIMFGNRLENMNKHNITITEINDQKIDHTSKTQIVIEIVAGIHQLLPTGTAG